ncbi:uncharacterized protein [Montipora capricornis]|uniref:uncharacterized protein n=1 Tax=Montipora capricornis TaxID=246305 RepID=UPI0035F1ECE1
MNLWIPSLFCWGFLCSFVSASPSPQWLFQQIHALQPSEDVDLSTDALHAKKSDIPGHNKRKDGVKRLFKFLDSALQQSGSGNGEGSARDDLGFANQTAKQRTMDAEQQKGINSKESEKQIRNQQIRNGNQVTSDVSNVVNTTLTGDNQQGFKKGPSVSSWQSQTQMVNQNQYADASAKRLGLSSQTTAQMARGTTKYSRKLPPDTKSMQISYGDSPPGSYYGHTATSMHPSAISDLRSQVSPNKMLTMQHQQQKHTPSSQRFVGGLHRSNVQSPYYFTYQFNPNQYDSYYIGVNSIPEKSDKKSPEHLQEKPYGQPKRPRDQFHQQTRGLIPGRVPVRAYSRYPETANFIGKVTAGISPPFPNQRVSRVRLPLSLPQVTPSSSFARTAYYRNVIPQARQQAGLAFTRKMMRDYGYPVVSQAPVGRALINRKPQPRNLLTSLTATAARLVVPARAEAFKNSAVAESVWSSFAPQPKAHAV